MCGQMSQLIPVRTMDIAVRLGLGHYLPQSSSCGFGTALRTTWRRAGRAGRAVRVLGVVDPGREVDGRRHAATGGHRRRVCRGRPGAERCWAPSCSPDLAPGTSRSRSWCFIASRIAAAQRCPEDACLRALRTPRSTHIVAPDVRRSLGTAACREWSAGGAGRELSVLGGGRRSPRQRDPSAGCGRPTASALRDSGDEPRRRPHPFSLAL